MSGFDGRWKKTGVENAEALIKAIGASPEGTAKLQALYLGENAELEFKITGNNVNRKSYLDGKLVEDLNVEYGKEEVRDTALGKVKITTQKVSDTNIKVNTVSDTQEGVMEYILNGNELFLDYTVGGVKARRIFKRV